MPTNRGSRQHHTSHTSKLLKFVDDAKIIAVLCRINLDVWRDQGNIPFRRSACSPSIISPHLPIVFKFVGRDGGQLFENNMPVGESGGSSSGRVAESVRPSVPSG